MLIFCALLRFHRITWSYFFGKIRQLCGCNNNPSARQFISAYRKLIVHRDIQDVVRGNCLPLESLPILTASSGFASQLGPVQVINESVARSRVVDIENIVPDCDYDLMPQASVLSSCSEKIVVYIAGFVVFRLRSVIHCETCLNSLQSDISDKEMYSLTNLKSKGCLIIPAQDVINICIICERLFRKNVTCGDGSLSRIASHKIVQSVMKHFLYKPCFENLSCHMFDTEPDMNHAVLLLKAISEKICRLDIIMLASSIQHHCKASRKK